MHTLWEKKVAASPSHGSNPLDEEYLLLNKDDTLRLEKDFQNKKIQFHHKDKDTNDWLEERFQEFLCKAKKYIEINYVIYYEVR